MPEWETVANYVLSGVQARYASGCDRTSGGLCSDGAVLSEEFLEVVPEAPAGGHPIFCCTQCGSAFDFDA